jgi:hypothetical protein
MVESGTDGGRAGDEERLRAEEIIAGIYARLREVRAAGKRPTAIVMPVTMYRTLQAYRAQLGEVRQGLPDYLGKYELFGVPIYTEGGNRIAVKTRSILE